MADRASELTDEEKVQQILGDDAKNAEEPKDTEEESVDEPEQPEDEPEKPETPEGDDGQPATFTKQFNNLKGDSWDTYGPELETAYQNSFTEAMRLKKDLDEARLALANLPNPEAPKQSEGDTQQASLPPDVMQRLNYIDSIQQRDMQGAFDKFKDRYPEVLDQANFDKFQKIATPVGSAFLAENGREPTYPELFDKMAGYLGWTATDEEGRRGQNLKETLGSNSPSTSQSKAAKRGPSVSDLEIDTYLKFFPSKSREDAVKELAEAKAS